VSYDKAMKKKIFYVIINTIVMLLADNIWFKLSGDFFKSELKDIANISNNEFQVKILPAIIVYLLMAIAVEKFVVTDKKSNISTVLINGALMGFLLYGVFDFTNLAILKSYSWSMVLVDVSWGTFLLSFTSFVNLKLKQRF